MTTPEDTAAGWSLTDLADRAGAALARLGALPADARAQALPDARTIRWYQTVGLLDRPHYEGRTARYGPRHLLQVVAVKLLQADGHTLAQIQARLAGASDAALRAVIGPDRLAPLDVAAPAPTPPLALPALHAVRLAAGVTVLLDPAADPALADEDARTTLIHRLHKALTGELP